MDGAHVRTLERALQTVGSKERLAIALDVPAPELEKYLAGETALPSKGFIAALQIVASGSP